MPARNPRLRSGGWLAGCALLMACGGQAAVTPGGGSTPSPAPSGTPFVFPSPPPAGPSLHDMSGTYVFGSTAEPGAGPVIGCYPSETLSISQLGGDVTGQVQRCAGACFSEESLSGTQLNGQLTLRGFNNPPPGQMRASYQVTYQLHFDAASQHLVGTRNGEPYWAAPAVKAPDCGPAPL